MSKRILAVLAACALMVSALVAPATSSAKRHHSRAKADACVLQPLDDLLGQIEANLAPVLTLKLKLCGPVT